MAYEENYSLIEDGVIPTFKIVPMKNEFRSKATGQQEFDNVELIHIKLMGDNRTEVVEPVNDWHKRRFPRAWEAFEKGVTAHAGTSLETFNDLDPATIAKMKSNNVYTIEQLAALSDSAVQSLGGKGIEFRRRATEFLAARGGDQLTNALEAQNAKIQELEAKLEALTSPPQTEAEKRPPGRPKMSIPPHMQNEA